MEKGRGKREEGVGKERRKRGGFEEGKKREKERNEGVGKEMKDGRKRGCE